MKGFFWIWMSALLVLAMAGCKSDEIAQPGTPQPVRAHVVSVEKAEVPTVTRSTGTLHAHESAMLSAQVMGRVQQVLVREGDMVRAGQTILILDDATLRSSFEQAEAAIKAAEQQQAAAQSSADLAASTLARYRQLEAQKSVSAQEMDEVTRRAEAAHAQADALRAQTIAIRAQQAGAKAMLAYTRIVAPFAGLITARNVDPGAMAAPGVPLLQIESGGLLELQTAVAESQIALLRKGMRLAVTVDAFGGRRFEGTVAEIVPEADPATHSFLVKLTMSSASLLRAGMSAAALIETGRHAAILAPASSCVLRGSLHYAYVLDSNNTAQLRALTLGDSSGGKVEVLSGLSSDERLVDQPGDRDLAGKRIEAQ